MFVGHLQAFSPWIMMMMMMNVLLPIEPSRNATTLRVSEELTNAKP